MKYFEIKFVTTPYTEVGADILREFAGQAGCESFIDTDNGFKAYAQHELFDEGLLKVLIDAFPLEDTTIEYSVTEAEYKNWNKTWEQEQFKPICIDGRCLIHSTQHKDLPSMEFDIKIDPEMSFGSGSHETTSMMLSTMMQIDMKGYNVLDMGCGTGILSVMAMKLGAKAATAIDIDEWSVKNTTTNAILNGATAIDIVHGTVAWLRDNQFSPFDVVLANINKNILIGDMEKYAKAMKNGGTLLMSGFYTDDLKDIEKEALRVGLEREGYKEKNNWCCVKYIKK